MARNKKHLEGLLKLISQITSEDGNEWFVQELPKYLSLKLNSSKTDQVGFTNDLPQNISDIKTYLRLDAIHIIDYSEILDEKTRVQLHMDCIQMGRYRLGKINHKPNFDEFCRYAHLQAEELINYYFKKNCKTPQGVLAFIKEYNPGYKSDIIPKSISSISYSSKLFTLKNYGLLLDDTMQVLLFLSEVRNRISHRSTYELAIKDEEELYHRFVKRFNNKYLSTAEKKDLPQFELKLYEDGLYLQKRKAEQWDKVYETLQNLLHFILSEPKEKQ